MNDLHTMHHQANESLARRLSDAMSRLRSGTGHISQAIQSNAGSALVGADAAQGGAEPGSDIASNKGGQCSGHRQQTCGCLAIKNIAGVLVCEDGQGVTE